MGHILFCALHLIAFLFGIIGLFLTIPLHLVYAAAKGPKKKRTGPQKQCSYCKELVLKKAIVCKHCGRDLPIEDMLQKTPQEITIYPRISLINFAIIIATFMLLFFLFAPLKPF